MKKEMKKYLSVAVSMALTLASLTGCGVKSTATTESAPEEVAETPVETETAEETATEAEVTEETGDGAVEKATEGELTIYTALEDDQVEKYLESFYEQYPDITLNVIRESTGTLVAKVIAEKDNPVADVIWGTSASVMLQLDQYDLIKGYTPEGADLLDPRFMDSVNEEAKWTGNDVYETAFLVNTEVCEKAGVPVPTSYEDLLDPMYKGMIIMPDPTSSGTGMLFVNGVLQIMGDDAWDYLTQLNENIASYTTSGSKPAKMAAAGECAIGISFGYRCAQLLQEGNPVEVVFPSEGCGWDVEANCLINKEEISPAAYTFLDWSISDPAMEKYATEYPITGRGVIGEIPVGYSDTPLENLCDLDLVKAANERDEVLDKFSVFLAGKIAE